MAFVEDNSGNTWFVPPVTFNEETCHQLAFFTVPPPPIGTCWRIEWRWAEEPSDSWTPVESPGIHEITMMGRAMTVRATLARDNPSKEFRIVTVKWREVTEPTML